MKLIYISFAAFLLTGCEYEKLDIHKDAQQLSDSVSYLLDIKPIIITYCLGTAPQRCHVSNSNQGSPGDFSTYAGLKAKVDNGMIASRVLNPVGGMPPDYSLGPRTLNDIDKELLKEWINQGSREN